MSFLKRSAKKFFPPHTPRGRALKKAAVRAGVAKPFQYDAKYQQWLQYCEQDLFLPPVRHTRKKAGQPLFSFLVPAHNVADKYLFPLVDSIINQSFEDWELILTDDSTDSARAASIQKICEKDTRMKYTRHMGGGKISGNTNHGLGQASGEFIVFVDHDDVLSSHALNEVAAILEEQPDIDIFYSDEDKLSDSGTYRHSPFFKPGWSPHTFLNTNYTNHLSVVRRRRVEDAGGLRPEFNGAQDYDLLLRIHDLTPAPKVHHIDKILYYWREADGSTAAEFALKPYALEAGRKALEEHLARNNWKGTVEVITDRPGFYRVRFEPPKKAKALVIVAANDNKLQNDAILEKIQNRTKSERLDVTFKATLSLEGQHIDALLKGYGSDDYLIIITKSVLPVENTWLDELCGVAALDNVATLSPRIVSYDRLIADMGIIQHEGVYDKVFAGNAIDDMTLIGHAEWIKDVTSPSGACVVLRMSDASAALSAMRKSGIERFEAFYQLAKKRAAYNVVWSHVNFKSMALLKNRGEFANGNVHFRDKKLTISL